MIAAAAIEFLNPQMWQHSEGHRTFKRIWFFNHANSTLGKTHKIFGTDCVLNPRNVTTFGQTLSFTDD